MAISDVLFEAAEEIRLYLRRLPESYAPMKPRIDRLLLDMDGLRLELETPPKADQ